MIYVRTKSGLELVAQGITALPERGFVTMTKVRRLRYVAGYAKPNVTNLVGGCGDDATEDLMLAADSIEIRTDKIPDSILKMDRPPATDAPGNGRTQPKRLP